MGSLSEGSYAQGQTWDVGHDFVAVAELHLGDLPVSTIRLFWCRNVHLARQRKQQISKMRYIAWQSVTKDKYALCTWAHQQQACEQQECKLERGTAEETVTIRTLVLV